MGKNRFAGAGFADETENFPFPDGKRHSIQGTVRRGFPAVENDGKPFDLKEAGVWASQCRVMVFQNLSVTNSVTGFLRPITPD